MSVVVPEHVEHMDVAALIPYARNSRTHSDEQIAQIARSMREYGFTNPVLIDGDNGIIAGHGRVLAANQVGLQAVPCIRLEHLSAAQKRTYIIADNKIALNAGWDNQALHDELQALRDLEYDVSLTGFDDDEFAELIAQLDMSGKDEPNPDDAPEQSATAVTRAGDIWRLGDHRVICGDATNPAAYADVLADATADLCWTDPPYNVDYKGGAGKIENDSMTDADFRTFLQKTFGAVSAAMKPGAAIYVAHADNGETGVSFRRALLDSGFKLAACLIWRKDSFVLGRSDYQWMHEPILYGWKKGAGHKWYGGRAQRSVNEIGGNGSPFVRLADGTWRVTIGDEVMIVDGNATVEYVENSVMSELRPTRSTLHPTMKPVALIERMLKNNGKPGAIVLDPFGGSGSTLMAAERSGMRARLIELSPRFVDSIVRRWQDYTGGGRHARGHRPDVRGAGNRTGVCLT